MRGPDWKYKNQDGGKGKEGVVKKIVEWRETPRSAVVVSWDETGEGNYRLGFKGKVSTHKNYGRMSHAIHDCSILLSLNLRGRM